MTTVSARDSSTRSRRTSSQSLHRDDSAGDVDVMAAIANYSFGTNTRVCARVFGLEVLTF